MVFCFLVIFPLTPYINGNPGEKPGVFRRPSGNANGNTFDTKGRLISGEHGNRRVSRMEKNGKFVTIASKYKGKRLNSPNDLAVKSDWQYLLYRSTLRN